MGRGGSTPLRRPSLLATSLSLPAAFDGDAGSAQRVDAGERRSAAGEEEVEDRDRIGEVDPLVAVCVEEPDVPGGGRGVVSTGQPRRTTGEEVT